MRADSHQKNKLLNKLWGLSLVKLFANKQAWIGKTGTKLLSVTKKDIIGKYITS